MNPAAWRLTEAHRLAQARLGADTVRLLVPLFQLLNPTNLTGSFDTWLRTVIPTVQTQRAKSSRLAGAYLQAHRLLELGPGAVDLALAEDAPIDGITTSMLVTGPIAYRDRLTRMSAGAAADMTLAGSAAAAMRWALNGGRETILNTVQTDRHARGWERVTSGAACDFCSMLADRGAVYSEDSADFEAHDHCSCSAAPLWN